MTNPVIITLAINGETSKKRNPHVPHKPEEIAADAGSEAGNRVGCDLLGLVRNVRIALLAGLAVDGQGDDHRIRHSSSSGSVETGKGIHIIDANLGMQRPAVEAGIAGGFSSPPIKDSRSV